MEFLLAEASKMEKKKIKIDKSDDVEFEAEKYQTDALTLYTIGPSLKVKAKTALYFSLSGQDSLMTPPFATPAILLAKKGYRVISVTLPAHSRSDWPRHIRPIWGETPSLLRDFFSQIEASLDEVKNQIIGHVPAIGLSRGAFVATHLAARLKIIDTVLGFAPLTFLEDAPTLDLIHLANELKHTRIHYTIGHKDTLVDTSCVIRTVSAFINALNAKERQNSNITLSIVPSIGKDGHGTSGYTFEKGISWLTREKGAI